MDCELFVLTVLTFMFACFHFHFRFRCRCHKTLLAFHNLRAAVSLLLLAVNSLELARSLLPQRRAEQLNELFDSMPRERNVLIFIGAGAVWNSLAAVLLTIMLMSYHRLLERKKVTGAYVTVCVCVCASVHLQAALINALLIPQSTCMAASLWSW